MNIDPNTYGYTYQADIYCPECTVEVLIDQGKATPAAREMGSEEVIDQMVAANAIGWPESHDSDSVPQRLGAYDGIEDDTCGRCTEVIYQ